MAHPLHLNHQHPHGALSLCERVNASTFAAAPTKPELLSFNSDWDLLRSIATFFNNIIIKSIAVPSASMDRQACAPNTHVCLMPNTVMVTIPIEGENGQVDVSFLMLSNSYSSATIIAFRKLNKPNANDSVKEKTVFCACIESLSRGAVCVPANIAAIVVILLVSICNLVLRFTFRKCIWLCNNDVAHVRMTGAVNNISRHYPYTIYPIDAPIFSYEIAWLACESTMRCVFVLCHRSSHASRFGKRNSIRRCRPLRRHQFQCINSIVLLAFVRHTDRQQKEMHFANTLTFTTVHGPSPHSHCVLQPAFVHWMHLIKMSRPSILQDTG